jgi:hypothetical protein
LSEKQNLAAKRPDLVQELDAQIEHFLADTKAVVPVRNPAFEPAAYRPEEEGRQKAKANPKAKAKANTKTKKSATRARSRQSEGTRS